MRCIKPTFCLIVIGIVYLLTPVRLAAQSEEKLLDDINQLPEAQRQSRLVAGAKNEGVVNWYVAMNRVFAQELVDRLQSDYPFVRVNTLTGSGGALLNRALSEQRAKSYQFDVFNTRSM